MGVGGTAASDTSVRTWPISVWRPVAVTSATPPPSATTVPAWIMFVRSAIAPLAETTADVFATGTLSPVSADSSTWRPSATTTRPSAGTS